MNTDYKYGISILICTIPERKNYFDRLIKILKSSINTANAKDFVEILYDDSGRHMTIGQKRNILLNRASREYVAFIDDDDTICENYVAILLNAVKDYPDCVSLNGIITTNGKDPHKFIHSLKYDKYSDNKQLKEYYRPPNHLNCIKSEIAKKYKFIEKNFSEDTDWAMEIARSKALKTEYKIDDIIYYYEYKTNK